MGAFTKVAGQSAKATVNSGFSVTATLAAAPIQGNLVIASMHFFGNPNVGTYILSIRDANNNLYTPTPNSPSFYDPNIGQMFLALMLSAPYNATAAVTVTFSNVIATATLVLDEFSCAAGVAALDNGIIDVGGPSSTVSTPIVPVTHTADELLYASCKTSSFDINGVGGAWTASPSGIPPSDNILEEYILSASANTAVNFSQGSSSNWTSIGVSIYSFVKTPIVPSINFATLNIGDELKIRRADGKVLIGLLTATFPQPNSFGTGFVGELNNGGRIDYFTDTDTLLAQVVATTTTTINGPSTSRYGPQFIPGQDPYTLGH
jgi:hypothetical protein